MATHEPIDPETLTREQRELWDAFMLPAEPSLTPQFADAQFRYILSLYGIPLEEKRSRT